METFFGAVDSWMFEAVQGMHCPFLDAVMPYITKLGDLGVLWIIVTAALLISKKYRACGYMMAAGVLLSLIVGNAILKPWIARPRPYETFPQIALLIDAPSGFSFPSAHAMTSCAAAAALFCGWKKAGIAALVCALLISFSRIYLYVHYPTDVMTGMLIGAGLGILAAGLVRWIMRMITVVREK